MWSYVNVPSTRWLLYDLGSGCLKRFTQNIQILSFIILFILSQTALTELLQFLKTIKVICLESRKKWQISGVSPGQVEVKHLFLSCQGNFAPEYHMPRLDGLLRDPQEQCFLTSVKLSKKSP